MTTLIQNATIINEQTSFIGAVLIKDDRIVEVLNRNTDLPPADKIIDATGLLLLPGVIDDQVHFRDPGLTHKADIYTESKAAVAGGITSYMEMPNTMPQTTTIERLEEKYAKASEASLANYSFYMGATNDNIDEILKADPSTVCGIKCFMGSSTGNMLVEGEGLETLFAKAHMLVATHCEEEEIIKNNTSLFRSKYGSNVPIKAHPLIRSEEACYQSSKKAVDLARKHNTRLHILHLSTAKELELFKKGEPDNKQITAEVCIHHLWFDDSFYESMGTKIKWNPAIKTKRDKLSLRDALKNNIIDVVATDHAPHTLEEKSNTYFNAPSGGPLVQHALVAMLELVKKGVFTYEMVVDKMCHAPAKLFNVADRGYIKPSYKADLILVKPDTNNRVDQSNILYKCKWSPFEGDSFHHQVVSTFVNGNLVFHNGEFNEKTKGERLHFNRG